MGLFKRDKKSTPDRSSPRAGTYDQFLVLLQDAVKPPKVVRPITASAWKSFAELNGFPAPADFRAFIDRYGVGDFGFDEIGPWTSMFQPVGSGSTFVEQSETDRAHLEGLQRQHPEFYPEWPMWPHPGGFLPWAVSVDGDRLGWITEGEPDSWDTAIVARGGDSLRFSFGFVEFQYRWFTGKTGIKDVDEAATENLADEELRFFPAPPPDPSPQLSRTELQIFLGPVVGPVGPRPGVPHDFAGRWLDHARHRAPDVKVASLMSTGWVGAEEWQIGLNFLPQDETQAKDLVIQLADELGAPVRECRNLRHELVWQDVVERASDR